MGTAYPNTQRKERVMYKGLFSRIIFRGAERIISKKRIIFKDYF
jgi:hypothetical protein